MKTALEWKKYYSSPEFREHYIYDENDLGVTCTDSGTSFKLWSPSADSVTLNLYHEGSGGEAYIHIPMEKEDKGVWSWLSGENMHGVYYDYSLSFEGESVCSADPYAYACGINGRRSMAVDLKKQTRKDGKMIGRRKKEQSRLSMNFMLRNFPGIRQAASRNHIGENTKHLLVRIRHFSETVFIRRE